MSSTSKTANLGLNQWEGTDPVEMADFNADNAKLDEAIGKRLEWELMGEYVTEDASGSTISLDVSGYDLSEYMFVAISIPEVSSYTQIHLNNVAEKYAGYVDEGSVCFMLTMKDGEHYPVLVSARRGAIDSSYSDVLVKNVKTIILKSGSSNGFRYTLRVQVWGIK